MKEKFLPRMRLIRKNLIQKIMKEKIFLGIFFPGDEFLADWTDKKVVPLRNSEDSLIEKSLIGLASSLRKKKIL